VSSRARAARSAALQPLTADGRTAHARVAALIDRSRAVVMTGLTPHQYRETVEVLETMAGNVEAALTARP
jgi:hypothetical protein